MIAYKNLPQGATVPGAFIWPDLTEPSFKFDEYGVFKVGQRLEGQEAQDFIGEIEEFFELAKADMLSDVNDRRRRTGKGPKSKAPLADLEDSKHRVPYQPAIDPDTEEEIPGVFEFRFKRKASGKYSKKKIAENPKLEGKLWHAKVRVMDASGQNPVTTKVYGGTVGRVAWTLDPWYTDELGFGVRLKLREVRVLELVSGGGESNESMFGAADEGYEAPQAQPEVNDDAVGEETEETEDF